MTAFNLDDIGSMLDDELEQNTARIGVNEVKEANKSIVQQEETSIETKIEELTLAMKSASTKWTKVSNINVCEKSALAAERGMLMFQLDDRAVKFAPMAKYFMMLGEELFYLASKNPEIAQLVKNLGIPKP